MPLFARVTVEPGAFITYSDIDGNYSFDSLPPGRYVVIAELQNGKQSNQIEVDLCSKASIRLDLGIAEGLSQNSVTVAIIKPHGNMEVLRGEIIPIVARIFAKEGILPGT